MGTAAEVGVADSTVAAVASAAGSVGADTAEGASAVEVIAVAATAADTRAVDTDTREDIAAATERDRERVPGRTEGEGMDRMAAGLLAATGREGTGTRQLGGQTRLTRLRTDNGIRLGERLAARAERCNAALLEVPMAWAEARA